jgi:uncharacterized protein (TIGR03086 family)
MTQKGAPMPFEKSVVVPLNADETFALITEPDRLRRWQVITARVDLRAGGDYRWTIVPGHSAAALEAWNARGLEGQVKAGPAEMPAGLVLGILSIEFLVHAWDFAQATGQQVSVSDALGGHVLGVAGQVIRPELRAMVGFADPVEAGPGAGYLERLIAFTGRDPSIPSSAASAN